MEPWWLRTDLAEGSEQRVAVRSRALKQDLEVRIWSPVATKAPMPLLVVHDGPEFESRAGLLTYAAAVVGTDELQPFRVALLPPGERDEWYSASALYTRALVGDVLPALRSAVRVEGLPVGMGASLGGLALLHAHRRHPDAFAGLFLQSASFFIPRFDSMESGFPRYGRIVRFVRATRKAGRAGHPIPIGMVCGGAEENLHNNRVMAAALAAQGYDVRFAEVPAHHDWTTWRGALDPHMTDLLLRAWWY